MIDRETIDRIYAAANIVEIIGDYVTLRRKGVNYQACCPFHNEKTPSFVVSPSKGVFKCFGCGKGGNAVTFLMEHEQMTYPGQRVQVDVKVVPRACIADPELRLFQYTAIDEFTRLRFLAAYPEQSTYSSADFLRRLTAWYARRGIEVECVQTDNGFEFTNRFSNSKRDLPTLFEKTAAELNIRHKLIRPYTPRHNGKVERSHREDQKRFYSCHSFYSLDDFAKQLSAHNRRSNNLPMRPLRWLSPAEFTVQYV